jgi:hypothetical protein
MRPLNDLFSMAEACLIADSMEIFRQYESTTYVPFTVVEDIRNAINDVHTSGVLHNSVVLNMPKFIEPSPDLFDMLEYLRNANKRIFLCTNR